jgi:hypothetical protein
MRSPIVLRLLPRKPVRIDLTDSSEPEGAMSLRRRQLMEQITAMNPSATPDFLDQFDEPALAQYLDHLALMNQPRGKQSRWVRPHGRPWAFAAAACA